MRGGVSGLCLCLTRTAQSCWSIGEKVKQIFAPSGTERLGFAESLSQIQRQCAMAA